MNIKKKKSFLYHMVKRIPRTGEGQAKDYYKKKQHLEARSYAADSEDSGKRNVASSQYYHIGESDIPFKNRFRFNVLQFVRNLVWRIWAFLFLE